MIHHLTWSFALRWGTRGLTFVRLAILARLLDPSQFGRFAIGTMVLAFLEIVTETWINVFLVQEKDQIDKYISSAWLISLFRGSIIGGLLYLSSGFIAIFFASPESLPLLRLLALVPFIRGLINPAVANLQKHLQFKKEFFYRLGLFIFESVITITFALLTHSATSFVIGMVCTAVLETTLSFILFSPRPRFAYSPSLGKEIFHRSKWLSAAGIFNYLYQHTDNLAVGRLLGSSPLGIYDYAYKISSTPITEIGDVFAKISFPIYVRLQSTPHLLKKTFLRNSILVAIFAAVFSLLLFLFSDAIITIVLGSQWTPAIPVVKVLTIYGFSKALIGTTFPLFLAIKKQSYVTLITLTSIIGLVISIVPLISRFGLVGAGMSASFGTLLSLPVAGVLLKRTLRSL